MSEMKTYKCDECQCMIGHNEHGAIMGLLNMEYILKVEFDKLGERYQLSKEDDMLDFCSLDCLAHYIIFLLMDQFDKDRHV